MLHANIKRQLACACVSRMRFGVTGFYLDCVNSDFVGRSHFVLSKNFVLVCPRIALFCGSGTSQTAESISSCIIHSLLGFSVSVA